jgi:hypothetical protein
MIVNYKNESYPKPTTDFKLIVEILNEYIENSEDFGRAVRKLLKNESQKQEQPPKVKPSFITGLERIEDSISKNQQLKSAENEYDQEWSVPAKTSYSYQSLRKFKKEISIIFQKQSNQQIQDSIESLKLFLKQGGKKNPVYDNDLCWMLGVIVNAQLLNSVDERGYVKGREFVYRETTEKVAQTIITQKFTEYVLFNDFTFKDAKIVDDNSNYVVLGRPNKTLPIQSFIKKIFEEGYINETEYTDLQKNPRDLYSNNIIYKPTGKIEYERRRYASYELMPQGLEKIVLLILEKELKTRTRLTSFYEITYSVTKKASKPVDPHKERSDSILEDMNNLAKAHTKRFKEAQKKPLFKQEIDTSNLKDRFKYTEEELTLMSDKLINGNLNRIERYLKTSLEKYGMKFSKRLITSETIYHKNPKITVHDLVKHFKTMPKQVNGTVDAKALEKKCADILQLPFSKIKFQIYPLVTFKEGVRMPYKKRKKTNKSI